jgi:hypothetical protein
MIALKVGLKLSGGDDVLEVTWDGNVWIGGEGQAQYANQSDAMRQVVYEYMLAGGEDLRDTEGEIDHITLADYGEWVGVEYYGPVSCPHCGQRNTLARVEGATEGPREYHAHCWEKASEKMSPHDVAMAWEKSPLEA